MKKKLLGLLISLAISIPAFASITVSPTRIELNANKVRSNYATTAIEIKGDATQAMRYKVYPGYFKISNDSKISIVEKSNDIHDLSNKIRFVPSEFTVAPGKSQKLRVNIANIKSLPDGESRALLYVEDVNAKEINVPNSMGIGAQLILKTRVAIPIYVDKGKFTKRADVESFEVIKQKDGYYTKTKIVSQGNTRVRYNGIVQIAKGRKLIQESNITGKVIPHDGFHVAVEKLKTDKIKEPGDYTVKLIFYYFDENGNRKNIKKDAILQITGEI